MPSIPTFPGMSLSKLHIRHPNVYQEYIDVDCHDGGDDVAGCRVVGPSYASDSGWLTNITTRTLLFWLSPCVDHIQPSRRNSSDYSVLYRTGLPNGRSDQSIGARCNARHCRYFPDNTSEKPVPDPLPVTNRFFSHVLARRSCWRRPNGYPTWLPLRRLLLGTYGACFCRGCNKSDLDDRRDSLYLN